MIRTRNVFLLGLGLLWIWFFSGCNFSSTPSPGPIEDFSLALYMGDYSVLFLVAEEQDFFRENGIRPSLIKTEAGAIAYSHLLENKVDFACCTESAYVSLSMKNDQATILASLAETDNHEVVARRDRGIATPPDLAGKRIGYTPNTSGEYFLRMFLAFQQVPFSATEAVPLQPKELVQALEIGDIDAASSWEYNVDQIKQALKDNVISWPSQNGQNYYWLLLSNRNTIQTKTALVGKLLRALIQAENFIRLNPESAMNRMIESTGRRRAYVEYSWPKMRLNISLPQELIVLMEDEASFVLRNGQDPSAVVPNYLNRIDQSVLQSVKPKSISIYR